MSIETDHHGNPILTQFSADGFVDCAFRIAEASSTSSSHKLRLLASHDGAVVGFIAIVRRGIRGGFTPNMELVPSHVYRPAVRFRRSGQESDRLVEILSELYGQGSGHRCMVKEIAFTGIALHEDGIDMEREPIRIKLFGHDTEPIVEENYFESFFNLDLPSGFAYWNEKDPDYRAALLRGVTAAPAPAN